MTTKAAAPRPAMAPGWSLRYDIPEIWIGDTSEIHTFLNLRLRGLDTPCREGDAPTATRRHTHGNTSEAASRDVCGTWGQAKRFRCRKSKGPQNADEKTNGSRHRHTHSHRLTLTHTGTHTSTESRKPNKSEATGSRGFGSEETIWLEDKISKYFGYSVGSASKSPSLAQTATSAADSDQGLSSDRGPIPTNRHQGGRNEHCDNSRSRSRISNGRPASDRQRLEDEEDRYAVDSDSNLSQRTSAGPVGNSSGDSLRGDRRTRREVTTVREVVSVYDSTFDDPRVENPRVEDPRVEDPRVEDPLEDPRVEDPRVQDPRVATSRHISEGHQGRPQSHESATQIDGASGAKRGLGSNVSERSERSASGPAESTGRLKSTQSQNTDILSSEGEGLDEGDAYGDSSAEGGKGRIVGCEGFDEGCAPERGRNGSRKKRQVRVTSTHRTRESIVTEDKLYRQEWPTSSSIGDKETSEGGLLIRADDVASSNVASPTSMASSKEGIDRALLSVDSQHAIFRILGAKKIAQSQCEAGSDEEERPANAHEVVMDGSSRKSMVVLEEVVTFDVVKHEAEEEGEEEGQEEGEGAGEEGEEEKEGEGEEVGLEEDEAEAESTVKWSDYESEIWEDDVVIVKADMLPADGEGFPDREVNASSHADSRSIASPYLAPTGLEIISSAPVQEFNLQKHTHIHF